jgi:polyether ionophore transport system ATP-binding protein
VSGLSVIEIHNLKKRYGKHLALDGIDLEVEQGEVFGYIGPNGAGKTTTLRILLGLLRKDAGTVTLLGGDPWHDTVTLHRRLAYVPGDVNLWPYLSGGEVIDLLARLRGGLNQSRRDELVARFKLDPSRQCRTYSKGNQQKVALIAALVSNVELLILDEPTLGLDPLMEAIFRECVAEAKGDGTTVLLSSHILSEVEALCDRISIINEGRIVETGSLTELRHLTRTTVSVETRRPITGLDRLPGVYNLTVEGAHARFNVDTDAVNRVLRYLIQFEVRVLTSAPPTLEDLFLRHYKLQDGVTR